MDFLQNWEYGRKVSVCLKVLGSQNSPMEASVAVLGWELNAESEKVGGYIGL